MKKYPKRGSFQDVKLNAEAVGFQIKESYKKARTNIAYSLDKSSDGFGGIVPQQIASRLSNLEV